MAVVALASAKGSPGVTTAALGLVARWPGPAVLVEADPAGGDLAPRFGAHRSPGLAEWAADSRLTTPAGAKLPPSNISGAGPAIGRGMTRPGIDPYVQRLPGISADVVFGASAEQMPAAVSLLIGAGGLTGPDQGLEQDVDLLLDLGRLDFSSDVLHLASDALVLLVARGWPDSVAALISRREALLNELGTLNSTAGPDTANRAARVGVLLVGGSPYTRGEIQAVAGLPVREVLPWDERGADVLSGRRGPGRAWTRTPLLRACRSLADSLYAGLHPDQDPDRHRNFADRHPGANADDGQLRRAGRIARWTA